MIRIKRRVAEWDRGNARKVPPRVKGESVRGTEDSDSVFFKARSDVEPDQARRR